jgi:hypothetical protein
MQRHASLLFETANRIARWDCSAPVNQQPLCSGSSRTTFRLSYTPGLINKRQHFVDCDLILGPAVYTSERALPLLLAHVHDHALTQIRHASSEGCHM